MPTGQKISAGGVFTALAFIGKTRKRQKDKRKLKRRSTFDIFAPLPPELLRPEYPPNSTANPTAAGPSAGPPGPNRTSTQISVVPVDTLYFPENQEYVEGTGQRDNDSGHWSDDSVSTWSSQTSANSTYGPRRPRLFGKPLFPLLRKRSKHWRPTRSTAIQTQSRSMIFHNNGVTPGRRTPAASRTNLPPRTVRRRGKAVTTGTATADLDASREHVSSRAAVPTPTTRSSHKMVPSRSPAGVDYPRASGPSVVFESPRMGDRRGTTTGAVGPRLDHTVSHRPTPLRHSTQVGNSDSHNNSNHAALPPTEVNKGKQPAVSAPKVLRGKDDQSHDPSEAQAWRAPRRKKERKRLEELNVILSSDPPPADPRPPMMSPDIPNRRASLALRPDLENKPHTVVRTVKRTETRQALPSTATVPPTSSIPFAQANPTLVHPRPVRSTTITKTTTRLLPQRAASLRESSTFARLKSDGKQVGQDGVSSTLERRSSLQVTSSDARPSLVTQKNIGRPPALGHRRSAFKVCQPTPLVRPTRQEYHTGINNPPVMTTRPQEWFPMVSEGMQSTSVNAPTYPAAKVTPIPQSPDDDVKARPTNLVEPSYVNSPLPLPSSSSSSESNRDSNQSPSSQHTAIRVKPEELSDEGFSEVGSWRLPSLPSLSFALDLSLDQLPNATRMHGLRPSPKSPVTTVQYSPKVEINLDTPLDDSVDIPDQPPSLTLRFLQRHTPEPFDQPFAQFLAKQEQKLPRKTSGLQIFGVEQRAGLDHLSDDNDDAHGNASTTDSARLFSRDQIHLEAQEAMAIEPPVLEWAEETDRLPSTSGDLLTASMSEDILRTTESPNQLSSTGRAPSATDVAYRDVSPIPMADMVSQEFSPEPAHQTVGSAEKMATRPASHLSDHSPAAHLPPSRSSAIGDDEDISDYEGGMSVADESRLSNPKVPYSTATYRREAAHEETSPSDQYPLGATGTYPADKPGTERIIRRKVYQDGPYQVIEEIEEVMEIVSDVERVSHPNALEGKSDSPDSGTSVSVDAMRADAGSSLSMELSVHTPPPSNDVDHFGMDTVSPTDSHSSSFFVALGRTPPTEQTTSSDLQDQNSAMGYWSRPLPAEPQDAPVETATLPLAAGAGDTPSITTELAPCTQPPSQEGDPLQTSGSPVKLWERYGKSASIPQSSLHGNGAIETNGKVNHRDSGEFGHRDLATFPFQNSAGGMVTTSQATRITLEHPVISSIYVTSSPSDAISSAFIEQLTAPFQGESDFLLSSRIEVPYLDGKSPTLSDDFKRGLLDHIHQSNPAPAVVIATDQQEDLDGAPQLPPTNPNIATAPQQAPPDMDSGSTHLVDTVDHLKFRISMLEGKLQAGRSMTSFYELNHPADHSSHLEGGDESTGSPNAPFAHRNQTKSRRSSSPGEGSKRASLSLSEPDALYSRQEFGNSAATDSPVLPPTKPVIHTTKEKNGPISAIRSILASPPLSPQSTDPGQAQSGPDSEPKQEERSQSRIRRRVSWLPGMISLSPKKTSQDHDAEETTTTAAPPMASYRAMARPNSVFLSPATPAAPRVKSPLNVRFWYHRDESGDEDTGEQPNHHAREEGAPRRQRPLNEGESNRVKPPNEALQRRSSSIKRLITVPRSRKRESGSSRQNPGNELEPHPSTSRNSQNRKRVPSTDSSHSTSPSASSSVIYPHPRSPMAHLPPESRPPPEDVQKHWAENHVKIALWEAMAFHDDRKAQRQVQHNPQTRRHTVTHIGRNDLPVSSPAKCTNLHPRTPRRKSDHSSVSHSRQGGSSSSKTRRNTAQPSSSTSRHHIAGKRLAKSSNGELPLQLPAQAMQSAFTRSSNDHLSQEGPQPTAASYSQVGGDYNRVAGGPIVNHPTRHSSTTRRSNEKEVPLTIQFDLHQQEARGSGRHRRSSQSTKTNEPSTVNKGRQSTPSYPSSPPPQVTPRGNSSRKYPVAQQNLDDTPQASLIHYDFKAIDEINPHFNVDEVVHKGPLHVTNFQPGDLDSLRSRDSSPLTNSPNRLTPLVRSPLSTAQLPPPRSNRRPTIGVNNTNWRIHSKGNTPAADSGGARQHYHQPTPRTQPRFSGESSRRVSVDILQSDGYKGPLPHDKRASTATFGNPQNFTEQRGNQPITHATSGLPMRLPLFRVRQRV